MDFKYEITDQQDDDIFDEKGNVFLAMRHVSWGEREPKLEIRKWNVNKEGEEVPNKGFSFLTEDGPHSLAELLVKRGYGDTSELQRSLMTREDYNESPEDLDSLDDDTDFYDPKELFDE